MLEEINRYRNSNGVKSAECDRGMCQFCLYHCWGMIKAGNIYHTEDYLLSGWAEAVGVISYSTNWKEEIIRMFGESEHHRQVIMESDILGCAYYSQTGLMYVTIRGKRKQ